ncbi:MAG: diaminopimelate epimerase [Turicibacter sp.]|nr:diaminopimelate epimerase [Turicibacter sp.]
MQPIFFTKLSILNTNYLILNYLEQPAPSLDYTYLAKLITHPKKGMLADKLIILLPSELADYKIIVYTKDGMLHKMCGNGLQVIGHYLHEIDRFNQPETSIETDANVSFLTDENKHTIVNLGFAHSLIESEHLLSQESQINQYCGEIETNYGTWQADMISMGNPHFIIYTTESHDTFFKELEQISKKYQVNVGMLTIINSNEMQLTTYEYGVGLTEACVTNAAAALTSAIIRRLIRPNEWIIIHLTGGDLQLKWNNSSQLLATSPCHKLCCGTYFFEEELVD